MRTVARTKGHTLSVGSRSRREITPKADGRVDRNNPESDFRKPDATEELARIGLSSFLCSGPRSERVAVQTHNNGIANLTPTRGRGKMSAIYLKVI